MSSRRLRLLLVDDNPLDAALLRRHLGQLAEYAIEFEHTQQASRDDWADVLNGVDLVFLDYRLGMLSGLDLLTSWRLSGDRRPVIVLTGQGDEHIAANVMQAGADDYLTKDDLSPDLLRASMGVAFERFRKRQGELRVQAQIAGAKPSGSRNGQDRRAEQLVTLHAGVRALVALADAASVICPEAWAWSAPVALHVRQIVKRLQAPRAWEVELAATLALVGYTAVPPAILQKHHRGEELAPQEKAAYQRHLKSAWDLLSHFPQLSEIARIVLYQDKGFDGLGPPDDDLRGTDIPLGSRIIKAAGDYERWCARGLASEDVLSRMSHATMYDPEVVEALSMCAGDGSSFESPSWQLAGGEIVPIKELRPDNRLAADVRTLDGHIVLARAGEATDSQVVELLRGFRRRGEGPEFVAINASR